jgi:hypothetical protein
VGNVPSAVDKITIFPNFASLFSIGVNFVLLLLLVLTPAPYLAKDHLMLKRILLYFVVMVILLGVALSAGQWDKDTTILQQHAGDIGVWLGAREAEALAWSRQHGSALQQVTGNGSAPNFHTPRGFRPVLVEHQVFAWQIGADAVAGGKRPAIAATAFGRFSGAAGNGGS